MNKMSSANNRDRKENAWTLMDTERAGWNVADELMEQRIAKLNAQHAEMTPACTNEKRVYSVDDIMAILDISAYILIKKNFFRSVKVGKQLRISKASFDAWLNGGDLATHDP